MSLVTIMMFPYGMAAIDGGFAFVNNIEFKFHCWVFPCGGGAPGPWGLGAWFLNDSISCPKQLSLKITFIV